MAADTKRIWSILFFAMLVAGFFGVGKTVSAAEFVDQSNWVNDANHWFSYVGGGGSAFCQSLIPQKANVSAIGFPLQKDNQGHYFCDDTTMVYRLRSGSCTGSVLGTITFSKADCDQISTSTPQMATGHFSSPVIVTPGVQYFITSPSFTNVTSRLNTLYGKTAANVFTGQQAYYSSNQGSTYSAGLDGYGGANFMFQEYWSDGLVSTTTKAFVLSPSADQSASTGIWNTFAFTGFIPNSPTNDVAFRFRLYSAASTTEILSETGLTLPANTFATSSPFLMAAASASFNYNFGAGTYYVRTQAQFSNLKQITDWSDPVRFYSTGGTYYQDCSAGDLFCYLQNAFVWAFIPAEGSFGAIAWQQTSDLFATKAPFSYLTGIRSEFESLNSDNASTTAIYSIPIISSYNGSTTTFSVPIIDTTNSVTSGVLAQMRPYEVAAIWVGLAIAIYQNISFFFFAL